MADINLRGRREAPDAGEAPETPARDEDRHEERVIRLIELMFFAYRDFIAEPDRILAEIGFGRAHHRVLHFVDRNPGLRVADLLEILQITKQSLGRVLGDLVLADLIERREGEEDKRERLLHATPAGSELAARLRRPQIERIERALADIGETESTQLVDRFLYAMITGSEKEEVAGMPHPDAPARPVRGRSR